MNGEASGCQTQAQPRPQRRGRRLRTRDQSHGIRVQATQRDLGAGRGGRGAEPRAQRLPGAQSSSLALSSLEPSARRLPESHVCTCGKRPARGLSVLLRGIRQDHEVCRDSLVPAPAPFALSCPSKVCPRAAPAPTQGGPGACKKAGLEPRRQIDFSRREIETVWRAFCKCQSSREGPLGSPL